MALKFVLITIVVLLLVSKTSGTIGLFTVTAVPNGALDCLMNLGYKFLIAGIVAPYNDLIGVWDVVRAETG